MGQKVHPYGFRLGITTNWKSNWYFEKKAYKECLEGDLKINNHLNMLIQNRKLLNISDFNITRQGKSCTVTVFTDKVSSVVGKGGAGLSSISTALSRITETKVSVDVKEVRIPFYADSFLLAQAVGDRIAKNRSFKDICKNCEDVVKSGEVKFGSKSKMLVFGIKIKISGRINGAEIARDEKFMFGTVTLNTLAVKVDYTCFHVKTVYGIIGVKVYISKQEIL